MKNNNKDQNLFLLFLLFRFSHYYNYFLSTTFCIYLTIFRLTHLWYQYLNKIDNNYQNVFLTIWVKKINSIRKFRIWKISMFFFKTSFHDMKYNSRFLSAQDCTTTHTYVASSVFLQTQFRDQKLLKLTLIMNFQLKIFLEMFM